MANNDNKNAAETKGLPPAGPEADGPVAAGVVVDRTEPTKDLFRALFVYMNRHPGLPEAVKVMDALRALVPDIEPPVVKVLDPDEDGEPVAKTKAPANAARIGKGR